MKPMDALRFPLSVGSSPTNLALGVAIFGFLGGGPVFFGSLLPNFMTLVCGLLIALWFFGLCALPYSFRKERASDLSVNEQGITVCGGRFASHQIAWSTLAEPDGIHFSSVSGAGTAPPSAHLALGSTVTVRSEDADEIASLSALSESLSTLATGYLDAAVPRPPSAADPRVLCCVRCGAPQPATAEEQAQCPYCGGQTPVPIALRHAVRDAAATVENRASTRSALHELQRWPRARRVNVLLAVAMLPLVLSWPVMAAFTSEFFQSFDILRWRDVFILFAATCSLSIGMVLLLQSQLVLRRAFALITASFHTLPPEQPGGLHRCRICSAPLAVREDSDQPLVVCPYCQSDNVVLGVLLPHTVHAESEQRQSLDSLLIERRRARNRWRLGFVVSVLLILVGGKVVWTTLSSARASSLTRHAPADRSWSYEPDWVKVR